MKTHIKTMALAISTLVLSNAGMAQTVSFDNLNANCNATAGFTGKSIIWNTSPSGNGFGHKIYNDDYNGLTYLKFAARHSATNWTDAMTITSQGKIGIGTDAPGAKLELYDASTNLTLLKLRNSNWACDQTTAIEFWNGNNKNYATSKIVSKMDGCGSDGEALIFETQTAGSTMTTPKLTIKNNGTILIPGQTKIGTKSSTSHANAMLTVDGKIVCKDLYVTASSDWPDFVFEKNYKLASLSDVRAYYEKNNHLPNVPTACEIEEKGINMSEMSAIQMQKIEELTMYIVQLKDELDELKKQISVKENKHD